ncbi:MAG: hypothetical protein CMJ83_06650 [Planctomycetes bacterium]|nr:hypothetical protein [Planctomycetota bacterium]
MNRIKSVCLFLGPYRNLTTLTASLLALHPTCQVLNHGKGEVFRDPGDNFLLNSDPAAFDRFLDVALAHSEGGQRGDRGGSITLSHAFDHDVMRDAYQRRYGDTRVKDVVECLVWKESLRTSNTLRKHAVDLDALFDREPRVRFLMPIRHPLDTARSNLKTGHWEIFRGLDSEPTMEAVIDAVIDEIAWFLDQRVRRPDRFFCYFQDAVDAELLAVITRFLDVAADGTWIADALACYDVQSRYQHDPSHVAHYRAEVERRLARHDDARGRLLGIA